MTTPDKMRKKKKLNRWSLGFNAGYACAVANLVTIDGSGVRPKELWNANPDFRGVDEYDRKIINEMRSIEHNAAEPIV